MSTDITINFSEPREKRDLIGRLAALTGMHRVTVVKYRVRRSDRQNRYYWPCFVHVFGEFLRDQGETVDDDQVHELLKNRFLEVVIANRATGEVIGSTARSTTKLSTVEFNDYLDRIAHWLAETFGIIVPDPDTYHEQPSDEEPETETAEPTSAATVNGVVRY